MNKLFKAYLIVSVCSCLLFSSTSYTVIATNIDYKLKQHIKKVATKYKIDEALIYAVIDVESDFNPKALSNKQSYGLMQIHKVNHERLRQKLGIKDFYNPYENIDAGAYMLRELKDKYKDDSLVLMAYNMGEYAMKKAISRGYTSSRYVREVKVLQKKYREQINKEQSKKEVDKPQTLKKVVDKPKAYLEYIFTIDLSYLNIEKR